jgi:murein DD-endopeptidase MepM/ murein hydrolase activator NlpD
MNKFILTSILCIYGLGISLSAYADTIDDLKSNVDSLSQQIKDLDKEIESYNTKIKSTQGEAKTLNQALANLEARRVILTKEITRTLLQIDSAKQKIDETKTEITKTQTVINRNKSALTELLKNIQQTEQVSSSFVTDVFSRASFSSTLDTLKHGTDVTNQLHGKVKNLTDAKNDLQTTKVIYEANKQQLESLNATLSDQKVIIEQTKSDKAQLLADTKNKESEYQKLLEERKVKKGALEQELLDVEAKIRVTVDVSKLPKYGKGVLKWPVTKVTITQYFGNTPFSSQNPQVYNGSGHNGVDFSAPIGTPIFAAESGVVLGIGNTDASCTGVSYGKWVLIRHTDGLTTLYAHLSKIDVISGQAVTVGEKIALSGNTGYSTGPHLHFTVYASDAVHISSPTEYKSKVCGTYLIMPLAPRAGYLNPLTYL